MRHLTPGRLALLATLLASLSAPAGAVRAGDASPAIVAAENVYGDLARQVAGPDASVTSILSNPDQDPHLFEADASTARALAGAAIVIANGADYDPWIEKLLAASPQAARTTIVAADLVGRHPGDNPHLWYDPATMEAVATRLGAALAAADPVHRATYEANAASYVAGLGPLKAKMAEMKARYAGAPVTASEPVFGYMAGALGLAMRNERFQTAVMNDTEPRPGDVAAFEDDLRSRKVRAMLYNVQADDEAVKRLVGIAREAGVPVVGVSETEPAGKTYSAWMLDQLGALDAALSAGKS